MASQWFRFDRATFQYQYPGSFIRNHRQFRVKVPYCEDFRVNLKPLFLNLHDRHRPECLGHYFFISWFTDFLAGKTGRSVGKKKNQNSCIGPIMSSCRKSYMEIEIKIGVFKETTSFLCMLSSHKITHKIYKQTKATFRGLFFQILCSQTEIKVDSIGSVFWIGTGIFHSM